MNQIYNTTTNIKIQSRGGNISLYIIKHKDFEGLLHIYHSLIGKPALPPLWSLGYHVSKWGFKDEKDVEEVKTKLSESGTPYDGVFYDLDYTNDNDMFHLNPNFFNKKRSNNNNQESSNQDKIINSNNNINTDMTFNTKIYSKDNINTSENEDSTKKINKYITQNMRELKILNNTDSSYNNHTSKEEKKLIPILNPFIRSDLSNIINRIAIFNQLYIVSNISKYYLYGHVWSGASHYLDFFKKSTWGLWEIALKQLENNLNFNGIWLDMNELVNFKAPELVDNHSKNNLYEFYEECFISNINDNQDEVNIKTNIFKNRILFSYDDYSPTASKYLRNKNAQVLKNYLENSSEEDLNIYFFSNNINNYKYIESNICKNLIKYNYLKIMKHTKTLPYFILSNNSSKNKYSKDNNHNDEYNFIPKKHFLIKEKRNSELNQIQDTLSILLSLIEVIRNIREEIDMNFEKQYSKLNFYGPISIYDIENKENNIEFSYSSLIDLEKKYQINLLILVDLLGMKESFINELVDMAFVLVKENKNKDYSLLLENYHGKNKDMRISIKKANINWLQYNDIDKQSERIKYTIDNGKDREINSKETNFIDYIKYDYEGEKIINVNFIYSRLLHPSLELALDKNSISHSSFTFNNNNKIYNNYDNISNNDDNKHLLNEIHHNPNTLKELKPLYPDFQVSATYDYLIKNKTKLDMTNKEIINVPKRPFILTRGNYVGTGNKSHHWLGDNKSSFESMRDSIHGIYNSQIFGFNLVGADICGFDGNPETLLCLYWHALGSFYPFSRNHSHKDFPYQFPYNYPNYTHKINEMIKLKYYLLRYYYSCLFKSSNEGGACFKPYFTLLSKFNDKYTSNTNAFIEEFLSDSMIEELFIIGNGLLVIPNLNPYKSKKGVLLLKGNYFNIINYKTEIKLKDFKKKSEVTRNKQKKCNNKYINSNKYNSSLYLKNDFSYFSLYGNAYGDLTDYYYKKSFLSWLSDKEEFEYYNYIENNNFCNSYSSISINIKNNSINFDVKIHDSNINSKIVEDTKFHGKSYYYFYIDFLFNIIIQH